MTVQTTGTIRVSPSAVMLGDYEQDGLACHGERSEAISGDRLVPGLFAMTLRVRFVSRFAQAVARRPFSRFPKDGFRNTLTDRMIHSPRLSEASDPDKIPAVSNPGRLFYLRGYAGA